MMPPKSVLQKYVSRTFMSNRREMLNVLIRAAIQADPDLSSPDLKAFLGVDAGQSWQRLQAANMIGAVPRMTQCDFEHAIAKVLTKGRIATCWESGKWKEVKTIGVAAAGDGTVKLMKSHHSGQLVAMKILPKELIMSCPREFDQKFPQDFERPWIDIGILKHLNSLCFPWSCDLLGMFTGTDDVYIMTSFANGGDLFTWSEIDTSDAGLEREVAMRPIVLQLVTAVCWLHNLGIAHRDLSLENVLLTETDGKGLQVKIIDFAQATLSRTARRQVRGKPSYQAPEMHLSTEYDSFLADSFAVGVILFCMGVRSYPWKHTKQGRDRHFDLAKLVGMENFLQRKKLPCEERTLAKVFSSSFMELLGGLLVLAPEKRYAIGGLSTESSPLNTTSFKEVEAHRVGARGDSSSDLSTMASFSSPPSPESSPRFAFLDNTGDENVDDWKPERCQPNIWDCQWLWVKDPPTAKQSNASRNCITKTLRG